MQSGSRLCAPLTAVWDTEKTCEFRRCGKTGRAEDCADFVPKAKFAGKRRAEAAAVRWAVRGMRVRPSAAMCARRLLKTPWTVRGPAMGNRAAARACRQRRGLGRAIPGRRAGRRRDLRGGSGLSRAGRKQEAGRTRRRAGQRQAERVGVRGKDGQNAAEWGQGRAERGGVRDKGGRNAEACGTETGGTRRRTGQGRAERGGVRGTGGTRRRTGQRACGTRRCAGARGVRDA